MKILYLGDKKKVANKHTYLYYGDMYRELCKITDVTFEQRLGDVKSFDGIDAIVFGLSYSGYRGEVEAPDIPKIYILHKPQIDLDEKLSFCKRVKADLLVYSQIEHAEYGERIGVPSYRLWMAGNPELYKDYSLEKPYDIGFSGALHGGKKTKGPTRDLRNRVYKEIQKMDDVNVFWNGSDSVAPRIKSPSEYAQTLNRSKIWLSTTGPLEDVGPRHFEVCLSKTLLFCNRMDEAYEDVFRDGENCVMFNNDLSDMSQKLSYYMYNDAEREKVISKAYEEFSSKHTWATRAKETVDKIKEIKNAKS
jgi:hypothetical protein